jgi:hypothetical protein
MVESRQSAVLEAVRSLLKAGSSVHKVTEAMAQIEDQTSRVPLRNLDWWEREIRRELWSSERHAVPRSWSASFRSKDEPSWLDLCSGDGRQRERALRSIKTPAPNAFFFALALRRLNDWVPQVRKAAQARIESLAQSTAPNCVADALCHELTHWGSWGRIEVADREVIVRLTELPAVAQALKLRILFGVTGPLAKLLSEVGRAPGLDPWLYEIASEAVQPLVWSCPASVDGWTLSFQAASRAAFS